MDEVAELLGPWPRLLLGGAVLAGTAVLVPLAVVFSLRVIESGITASWNGLRAGLHGLVNRAGARRPAVRVRSTSLAEDQKGTQ